jgi:hypothetical protein
MDENEKLELVPATVETRRYSHSFSIDRINDDDIDASFIFLDWEPELPTSDCPTWLEAKITRAEMFPEDVYRVCIDFEAEDAYWKLTPWRYFSTLASMLMQDMIRARMRKATLMRMLFAPVP